MWFKGRLKVLTCESLNQTIRLKMKSIKLEVTIDEANQILDALGNLSFKSVFALIGKIQNQASQQLNDTETLKDLAEG